MSSKLSSRVFTAVAKPTQRRCAFQAASRSACCARTFSTTTTRCDDAATVQETRPRWSYTPPAMKAPVRSSEKPLGRPFPVNEDPAKLDKFYNKLLGENGASMLSEETKWLAVTHKSFDQGRRGFNDRMSYLGRRIVELHTSLAIIESKAKAGAEGIEAIEGLSAEEKASVASHKLIAKISTQYGLPEVMRWKPKNVGNVRKSGIEVVLCQGMYAIVGALALEKGGVVAGEFTQQKIIKPLGL